MKKMGKRADFTPMHKNYFVWGCLNWINLNLFFMWVGQMKAIKNQKIPNRIKKTMKAKRIPTHTHLIFLQSHC
jgi:hypothetical protein